MGNGISPPAFCDIFKSHELRQFRVKGLGYMSLGLGFPISQIMLGHLGWDYLGNWEIGKYVPVIISQFPNFPNRTEPDGLRSFGKLGNLYLKPFPNFPISQIVLAHLGWCLLGNWEIGKCVSVIISQFPNGLGSFGKLGNWEICTSSHFPFPNFPNSAKPDGLGFFWEIWNLGNGLGEICL